MKHSAPFLTDPVSVLWAMDGGRLFMIGPDGRSCAERTSDGWVFADGAVVKRQGRLGSAFGFEPGAQKSRAVCSNLVLGPGWTLWEFKGRSFAVDRDGLDSVERTAGDWIWNSVPTCIIEREGVRVDGQKDG